MAASRRKPPRPRTAPRTPLVADDADILNEAGAELDEQTGDFLADPKKVESLGAIDTESVRENRRVQAALEAKAKGERVAFNPEDIFSKYEYVLKSHPPSTLHISVKRLGSDFEDVIKTHPRNGAEAIEAIKAVHGQHEEAKYAIGIYDTVGRQWRGKGIMTLPDTRQQGATPMTAPPYGGYPPQQQPPPWGYQQPPQPQWGYQQPPAQQPPAPAQQPAPQTAPEPAQPQPQPQPQPAPVVHFQPPPQPDPMQLMQQAFRMIQEMQASFSQQHQPPQQQQPPPQQPMPPLPPPGPGVDPMQYMQQAFEIVQRVQAQQQPQQPQQQQWTPPPQQPSQQNSMMEAMGLMREMFDMFQSMQPRQPVAPAFRRPSYEDRHPQPPPPPPEPPKTPAQQFRESFDMLKSTASMVDELRSFLPQPAVAPAAGIVPTADDEDEDSPVRIVNTGSAQLVLNKSDGSLRGIESIWANADKLLNWAGEQTEKIQRMRAEQAEKQRQAETRQLPPGLVHVTEGYEPPPGMVAVPVDPREIHRAVATPASAPSPQQHLPPPPTEMPPPIAATPSSGRSWQMPSFSNEGEG